VPTGRIATLSYVRSSTFVRAGRLEKFGESSPSTSRTSSTAPDA
jgi:hypothetical protein